MTQCCCSLQLKEITLSLDLVFEEGVKHFFKYFRAQASLDWMLLEAVVVGLQDLAPHPVLGSQMEASQNSRAVWDIGGHRLCNSPSGLVSYLPGISFARDTDESSSWGIKCAKHCERCLS